MKYIILLYIVASILFTAFFYFTPFQSQIDNKLFFTAAALFFTIFAGFLISRHSTRYSSIRDKLTTFDGSMSFVYRALSHFAPPAQQEAGEVLKNHYLPILKTHAWDKPFTEKTTVITDLHAILDKTSKHLTAPSELQKGAFAQMLAGIREAQMSRKNLIALEEERMPGSQWFLMLFLGALLFLTLLVIPSYADTLASFLKGFFGGTIVLVLIILWKLNRLEFFVGTIG